jgi:hypothetical protein
MVSLKDYKAMNLTFNNESELYAKIEQLKTEIKANKVVEDYRVSCPTSWYVKQKDYNGKTIQYDFTRSLLVMFMDINELVTHKLMATIRCERGNFTYSLFLNKIE